MKSLLFILVAFIAVTSTLSGLLMISDPEGDLLNLSISLLEGTPFKNFLMPGILLTLVVGGVNIIAIYHLLANGSRRYDWAMAGGIMITVWIVTQMILIQAIHWLHFVYLFTGILIILIAYQLKGKWAV
jgi:hypothetical protein